MSWVYSDDLLAVMEEHLDDATLDFFKTITGEVKPPPDLPIEPIGTQTPPERREK